MDANLQKKEIMQEIREKLIDFKSLYPDTSVKVSFDIPVNVSRPEKIRCQITEIS